MINTIVEWFLNMEYFIEKRIGYDAVISFEDLTVFLAGLFVGMMLMAFFASAILLKSHRLQDSKFDKFSIIKHYEDNKPIYFVNPNGLLETMKITLTLIFAPWFTIKTYNVRDEKRTKRFIIIIVVISIMVFLLALLSIFTVYLPHVPIDESINHHIVF